MAEHNQPVGVCPFCGSTLPAGSVLIEYEADDEQRVFARCSDCREPVHPE
jgi:formate dehydrogenase maturation protein FdhE